MDSIFFARPLSGWIVAPVLLVGALLTSVASALPRDSRSADKNAPASTARQPSDAVQAEDGTTEHARELFLSGTALAKRMQWAEALSMFREVARIRAHPIVTFNIGTCERALGHYTRARAIFAQVLEASRTEEVGASVVEEARNYEREIGGLLVHLRFTVTPHLGTHLVVDGRPLTSDGFGRWVTGVAADDAEDRVHEGTFDLVLDPGAHIFHATREGYTDAALNRSFPPGFRGEIRLELERLPARVHVDSTPSRATVLIDGVLVGETPVDVTRPAGSYHLEVRKAAFAPYASTVVLNAGGHTDLTARLSPATKSLTSRWWFWAGAVAVVATGAAVTYAATRPAPEALPYDGGGAGWVAVVK